MFKYLLFLVMFFLNIATPLFALQVKTFEAGVPLEFDIAADALTHIVVENDRITGVKSALDNLGLDLDATLGHLFVRPINKQAQIQIFITTEQGKTIGLCLNPQDIPVESITILSGEEHVAVAVTDTETVIQLMQALRDKQELAGYTVSRTITAVPMVAELPVEQTAQYLNDNWIGVEYFIHNTTRKSVALLERDFFEAGVRAAAILQPLLLPNQSTQVYVVRER